MASNAPFIRGKDVILKLYQNGKPVYIPAKNWKVEENAAEVSDDVNGEQRSRLDKVTNFYTATMDIFQGDQEFMDAYMAAQDADDNSVLPLSQSGAVFLKNRDGTRAAYMLQEMKVGPFTQDAASRQDAFMVNIKVRFRFYKKVPTL